MARISLAALLLASGAVAASDLLYVTSYAGTITTLNMTATSPAGGNYPAMKSVASNTGCTASPSWLTLDHPDALLYCIDEGLNTPGGSLSSYKTNSDGTLKQLGKVTTPGGPVSGVFYGTKGHGFAMAHYGGSTFSTWDVSNPASIKNVQTIKFTDPTGPKPEQDAPHPHEAVLDPSGKYLIVPDLGTDLIRLFSFDAKTLKTKALTPVKAKTGSGPRHVAFAVKGAKTYMYLITELGNTIVGYEVTYPGGNIKLNQIFDIGAHGEGRPVPNNAAASEIVVSPDNKFLIASSRRENIYKIPSFDDKSQQIDSDSIINFSIDGNTGKLNFLQDIPAGGRFPRQFSINKAGTKLAVGMQSDGRVVTIKRDPKSGKLGDFESFANIEGQITAVVFDELAALNSAVSARSSHHALGSGLNSAAPLVRPTTATSRMVLTANYASHITARASNASSDQLRHLEEYNSAPSEKFDEVWNPQRGFPCTRPNQSLSHRASRQLLTRRCAHQSGERVAVYRLEATYCRTAASRPIKSESDCSAYGITNFEVRAQTGASGAMVSKSKAKSSGASGGAASSAAQLSPPSANSRNTLGLDDDDIDDGSSSNPLKRRFDDGVVDYPRRRATIACEVCRSRKSRCDGNKPKCKLCAELGANCVYREPGVKLDVGDKMIIEQLSRIESMLQTSMSQQAQSSIANPLHPSPAISSTAAVIDPDAHFAGANNSGTTVPIILNGGLGTWASGAAAGTNISTMPKRHTNAAFHLLQWPLIRDLVPRQYDPQVLVQLEMEREPLHSLAKTPAVDLSNTQAYVEAYFEKVNVWYACVNPYTWRSHYRAALSNGFREGPESCIVLLVLALGQASLGGHISSLPRGEDPPGLQYFTAAWSLLPGMLTANNAVAAQCHLLAAAYLFYLARPLEAWNLLGSASAKLQLLLMSPARIPPGQTELVERIYWNTLLFESDLLAELDLPHSGVAQFEEEVGLPSGFEGDDQDPVGTDELWYFLAEIALRRLLNRVSQLLYAEDAFAKTSNLEPIVRELDYQLTQWYEGLPPALQFSFARVPLQDPVQTVLKLRYYACKVIIYRPYIHCVLEDARAIMEPVVREGCQRCLDASVRQLEHISEHHAGHMPYTWQGALSMASQSLLIMGATMSPSLQGLVLSLVPNRAALDKIIKDVIDEIGRYAVLAPSINLAADIVKEAEMRRRAFFSVETESAG